MAFLSHHAPFPMRSGDKDWSSAYEDLFNQYIDTDNLDFSGSPDLAKEISNSDQSSHKISDYSLTSSCQPGSSPPHRWSARESEADFWTNTLRSLERSAALLEHDKQGHNFSDQQDFGLGAQSDFLSLGGWPSPHISAPASTEAVKQRKSSFDVYRQFKPSSAPRSPGIKKNYRSANKSPKMMSPSRYKAGFQDVWANDTGAVSQTYTLTLPMRPAPLSPPPSAKAVQASDAEAFCSPHAIDTAPFQYMDFSNIDFSAKSCGPLGTMGVRTPNASPLTSSGVERGNLYTEMQNDGAQDALIGRSVYYAVPQTEQKSTRSSWVFPGEDECELSPTSNPWKIQTTEAEREVAADLTVGFRLEDIAPFASFHPNSSRMLASSGLMISCDPTFEADFGNETADMELSALPTNMYTAQGQESQRQRQDFLGRSGSPELVRSPQTPRSRRASSKGRRRRTPSTPRSPRGASNPSFVNFTPSDSAKLLTGVAPSGSSKTKARREKEALEKRRKFSQAAVRAVTEAGGDINRLRDVML